MSDLQGNLITNISDAEAASPTIVFGFGKRAGNKEQSKKSKSSKRSRSLTTKDLRDDDKLLEWFNTATNGKHPIVKKSEANRLNVFAAAERALEFGDDPPALFNFIVREKQFDFITQAQEDRAHQRLRRLRNPKREAERQAQRQRYDDDDAAQPPSDSCSMDDIVRELIVKFQSR